VEDKYGEAGFETAAPRRARKKRKSVGALILQDILLTGLILCVFALFHHVLPRLTAAQSRTPTPVPVRTAAPLATPDVPPTEQTAAPDGTAEPTPTPEPTPDPMDWRTIFAEHFTDEVVVTENSYTSPNVAITIDRIVTDDEAQITYFVADIYIADLQCFAAWWAGGDFRFWMEEESVTMARDSGAILTINGDYADNQTAGGLLVRNGQLYFDDPTGNDICVLYYDGTMETHEAGTYEVEDILAREPYQIWKFGPALLDADGQARERGSFNTTSAIADVNPRSGVGYYEPGHYCFVLVDGRQPGYSYGARIERFSQIFAELGCRCAYNLDGGRSSVLTFNQSVFNHPYLGGRPAGDILLIRELPGTPTTGEEDEP